MTLDEAVQNWAGAAHETLRALEQYAVDNYEAGGHWVVECFDRKDYLNIIERTGCDLNEGKVLLRAHWETMCERERECAWEGPR